MKVDAVIFDMDGTLFQTNRILEISLEDTFDQLRVNELWERETPIEKYRKIMGVPLPKVWETLLPCHTDEVRERVNEHFLERLIANIQSGKGALYPHVIETLTYLKQQQLKLFIASNGLPPYLEAIVEYYHLDRWIDEVFSIEQIESLHKSDLVHKICEKYGVQRGAVVGDRLSDIIAAKDNSLLAIGCRFDFSQEQELLQSDIVIEDLMKLTELFPISESINTTWTNY
jgi:phosphoglycolate phosphatase-like HAD superfamily hydrolase